MAQTLKNLKSNYLNATAPYFIATFLSLVIVLTAFRIFHIHPSLPLNYTGDAIVHYNFAKNIEQTGWWATNPHFGAPITQTLWDFPLTETVHLLLIKFLITIGLNWYQSVNAFYILTFPLTAIASLYVMRRMGIKTVVALSLSIIYAFVPYHFLRGVNHLFLSGYFVVPLAVFVAYRLASNNPLRLLELVVTAVLIASCGAYYTFFSALLIGTGAALAFVKQPNKKILVESFKILGMILIFFCLNFLPSFIYTQRFGANYNATVRQASEAELYGLKIAQLVLPFEDHNLDIFNKIQKRYINFGSVLTNENQTAALGLTATIGFLLLLAWIVFRQPAFKLEKEVSEKLDILSSLNLAAILFATVGGVASLLSTYINPTFRSVNRISIYIAFISLVAVGFLLQRIKSQKLTIIMCFVLSFAIFDQVSRGVMRNFTNNTGEYLALVEYARVIEKTAGTNAKIFTLPFGQYPEGVDKSLLRVALLTENISWSTGAEKWRAANFWQHRVYKLETKAFLEKIINEGFTGLLINVKELDPAKVTEIEQELSVMPMQDLRKEYFFYDLRSYASAKNISYIQTEIFYYVSGNCLYDHTSSFYCVRNGRIEFENVTDRKVVKSLRVEIELPGGKTEELSVDVTIPSGTSRYQISKDTQSKVFPIPSAVPIWPLNIGYPNFIIRNIELL